MMSLLLLQVAISADATMRPAAVKMQMCNPAHRNDSCIGSTTKLLDQAVEIARALPADAQDDIARLVLQLASDESTPVVLSPAERIAIAASKAQAARGEFATDDQVRAVWARHGL